MIEREDREISLVDAHVNSAPLASLYFEFAIIVT